MIYHTLVDTEFRMGWDDYLKKLDVLETHPHGNELMYLLMKLPTPLKNRDWVFFRVLREDLGC